MTLRSRVTQQIKVLGDFVFVLGCFSPLGMGRAAAKLASVLTQLLAGNVEGESRCEEKAIDKGNIL